MSQIISTTIREKNIEIYKQLKEELKKSNTSIGDFIIQSYNKTKQTNPWRSGVIRYGRAVPKKGGAESGETLPTPFNHHQHDWYGFLNSSWF